jgi:hypothetical protein
MLRETTPENPIWTTQLEQLARCSERDLLEIVQRLRLVHWDLEAGPMSAIPQR